MLKEFEIINNYFAKLVSKKESLNLQDDCAVFSSSKQMVLNVDAIIEEEHFFSNDPASSIASKLLNVNLSDIASMGATPKYWSMSISIPRNRLVTNSWLEEFCNTLQEIQNQYNFYLIAGDTTFTSKGMLTITANVFAEIDQGIDVLKKSTAKDGDVLCVSGSIGDSYWGLQVLKDKYNKTNNIDLSKESDKEYLINRYHYPKARVELGQILLNYANSCTDISDGLWIDAEKMCQFSGVLGVINIEDVPISQAIKNIKNITEEEKQIQAITGGEDYELVFSISQNKLEDLQKELSKKGFFIKEIGFIQKLESNSNKNLIVIKNGVEVYSNKKGYSH